MLWPLELINDGNRIVFERNVALALLIDALSAWAEKHFPDVLRAQQAYDRQAAR